MRSTCIWGLLVLSTVSLIPTPTYGQSLKNRLMSHLVDFSKPRSHQEPQQKEEARNKIREFFLDLANGKNVIALKQPFTWMDPKTNKWHDGVNYMLLYKGLRWGSSEDKISILMAHYDTRPGSPGVNDNGSGLAAMLETARVITDWGVSLKNSIIFAATDFEEFNLVGSRHFVNFFSKNILKRFGISENTFAGAYVLDGILNWDPKDNSQTLDNLITTMPGGPGLIYQVQNALNMRHAANLFRGDYVAVVGRENEATLVDRWVNKWNQTSSGSFDQHYGDLVIPFIGRPSSVLTPAQQRIVNTFTMFSDHYNFWENTVISPKGLKAVILSDTGRFRGYMMKCSGQPCDDLSHITPGRKVFLTRQTNTLIKLFACMAMDNCPV